MKCFFFFFNVQVAVNFQVATSLFSVHVMEKLAVSDYGSLSVSLLQKIHGIMIKVQHLIFFLVYSLLFRFTVVLCLIM